MIDLRKVQETAPALVSLYKEAGRSLRQRGMEGQRVQVYLVLDYSGSMKDYYRDGSVQAFADRVLSLSANLDDDGRVPTVFFSTDVDAVTEISLDNHHGRIAEIVAGLGHMGKTSYHLAMDAVIDHYVDQMDSGARDPALVVFQTDGGPINKLAAERYLCKSSKLPLFWQFVGFGNTRSTQFDFLRKLDDLPVPTKRAVDNAGFFHAGAEPSKVPDAELYDRMLAEFPRWLSAARAQGIVR
ncbi:VWA domain-containing protein [Streptomyces sp. NPDC048057]|uniref:VWA domain-containing protein n=1 Tax=Streptomyces sp. NPDC048057 TaxID=3155628 RepID=UPI0033E01185